MLKRRRGKWKKGIFERDHEEGNEDHDDNHEDKEDEEDENQDSGEGVCEEQTDGGETENDSNGNEEHDSKTSDKERQHNKQDKSEQQHDNDDAAPFPPNTLKHDSWRWTRMGLILLATIWRWQGIFCDDSRAFEEGAQTATPIACGARIGVHTGEDFRAKINGVIELATMAREQAQLVIMASRSTLAEVKSDRSRSSAATVSHGMLVPFELSENSFVGRELDQAPGTEMRQRGIFLGPERRCSALVARESAIADDELRRAEGTKETIYFCQYVRITAPSQD